MTQADESNGLLEIALDRVQEAEDIITGSVYQGTSALAAAFSLAKKEIERVTRSVYETSVKVQEAQAITEEAIAGTSQDEGSQAMEWLAQVEQENNDNVRKLYFLIRELDRFAREIIPVFAEENERNVRRLKGVAGHLRTIQSNL